MSRKKYCILERHNPQHKGPYYVALGRLTAEEIKRKENTLYGMNIVLTYKTAEEYNKAKDNYLKCKDF